MIEQKESEGIWPKGVLWRSRSIMSGVFIFQGATNLFEDLMLALDSLLREM